MTCSRPFWSIGRSCPGVAGDHPHARGQGRAGRLTSDLAAHGADIVSLTTFWGEDLSDRAIVFKVQDISREQVEQIIGEVDAILVDIRET